MHVRSAGSLIVYHRLDTGTYALHTLRGVGSAAPAAAACSFTQLRGAIFPAEVNETETLNNINGNV